MKLRTLLSLAALLVTIAPAMPALALPVGGGALHPIDPGVGDGSTNATQQPADSLNQIGKKLGGGIAGGSSSGAQTPGGSSGSSSSGGNSDTKPGSSLKPVTIPGHPSSSTSSSGGEGLPPSKQPDASQVPPPASEVTPAESEKDTKKHEQCVAKCEKKYNGPNDKKLVQECAGGPNENCNKNEHKKMLKTQDEYAQCTAKCDN